MISVIIPLYGQFDINRAIMSVSSVLAQRGINLELIVSEQGESPKFPKTPNVKHIFTYYQPSSELSDFNPGNIRNIGVSQAVGEFIYTTDADIIFSDEYHLLKSKEFLENNKTKTLFRPKMRRLYLSDFSLFKEWVEEHNITEAVSKLNYEQDYLVKVNSLPRKLRIFEKESTYKKTFTSFEEDFQKFMTEKNEGREPMFWNENRHCGGNMFRKNQFLSVGGYCEDFINWGCEDSDLQWKLSEKYGILFFPNNLEVIHLDHPKGYFSSKMWAQNERISAQRQKEGVNQAIKHDKENKLWNQ